MMIWYDDTDANCTTTLRYRVSIRASYRAITNQSTTVSAIVASISIRQGVEIFHKSWATTTTTTTAMDEAGRKFCMRIAHARRCPLTGNDLFTIIGFIYSPASPLTIVSLISRWLCRQFVFSCNPVGYTDKKTLLSQR